MTETRPTETRPTGTWRTLGIALIGQFAVSMANQGLSAVVPFMQADLRLTKSQVGLFASAAQFGNTLSFYGGGWIADTFGMRRLILAASIVIGLGLISLSRVDGLAAALIVLFLTGVGTGLGGPAVTLIIIRNFDRRRRGTAMGLKQTGVPGVGLLAALILPPLAIATGWRPAIFGMGVLSMLLGAVVYLRYRDRAPVEPAVPRPAGSPGAFRQVATNVQVITVSLFATALVALQFSVLQYYLLYANGALGWDLVSAGWLLGLVQLGGVVGRVAWGLVSDKVLGGQRKPIFLMTGGSAAILAGLLAFLEPATPALLIAVVSFLIGLSALGWHGIYHTLVAELVEPRLAGQATGASMTISQVGPILGPPLFGLVADLTASYRIAWLIAAGLATLATLVVAIVLREAPPAPAEAAIESPTPARPV